MIFHVSLAFKQHAFIDMICLDINFNNIFIHLDQNKLIDLTIDLSKHYKKYIFKED